MPRVILNQDRISVGRFALRLERTLRIPSNGGPYPLPPTFGAFPLYRSKRSRSFFVGMHAWEALWLAFEAAAWKPNAVQVFSGGINVLTGEGAAAPLSATPQNYLVVPEQPWLDGFKTNTGSVSQFVAAPQGQGLTVAEQLGAGGGGLGISILDPKAGLFPDKAPPDFNSFESAQEVAFGLAAGGDVEQKVYPDRYGLETWDITEACSLHFTLLDEAAFTELTGKKLPPSPISAEEYIRLGYPWYRLQDELKADLKVSPALKSLSRL